MSLKLQRSVMLVSLASTLRSPGAGEFFSADVIYKHLSAPRPGTHAVRNLNASSCSMLGSSDSVR
jgi:hypothetical protein